MIARLAAIARDERHPGEPSMLTISEPFEPIMLESLPPRDPVVYAVDDDPQASRATAELVRSFGQQVRTFGSPREFLEELDRIDSDQPGCVIIDLRMPGMDGLEVFQQIAERDLALPVILVTGYADTSLTVRALRSGVLAVLDKPCRDNELWSFIQEGLAKSDERRRRRRYQQLLEERFRRLSLQDRQVLQLILEGCKNRTMAKRLDVSLRTVENRRRRVFDVMQAESVAELTRMVMEYEHDLLPAEGSSGAWLSLPFERVA
jgi:two-component system, LuxR family, response regulator FixJ